MAAIVSVGSHDTTDITSIRARRKPLRAGPRVVAGGGGFQGCDVHHELIHVVTVALFDSVRSILGTMRLTAVRLSWFSSATSSCGSIGAS